MKLALKIIISVLFTFTAIGAGQHLPSPQQREIDSQFISDGQRYITQISENETAVFQIVFYENTTYRVAFNFGNYKEKVIFTLYDENQKELFTNADFDNSPYWNFKFESTIHCIIEARLVDGDVNAAPLSGFVGMKIGFKND